MQKGDLKLAKIFKIYITTKQLSKKTPDKTNNFLANIIWTIRKTDLYEPFSIMRPDPQNPTTTWISADTSSLLIHHEKSSDYSAN